VSPGRIGVFLDRDGTLIDEVDFLRTPEEMRLIGGTTEAVRKLNDLGIITCIISNQSGVARGILTEHDLVLIHAKLEQELEEGGARVDRIYYCPHHPTEGSAPYNIECTCRKPGSGMLRRGEKEFGLNLAESFVVGDSLVDMQAGAGVGARTVLVLTGHGRAAVDGCRRESVTVEYIAPTITEAVEYIVQTVKNRQQIDRADRG
jgi:D-glycero-D-manno-heptose 1,7-bisphosphate phosphatase